MKGTQQIAIAIGKDGCYFLSIVRLAETFNKRKYDEIELYAEFVTSGLIGEDCYVINPSEMLAALTGERWSVTKEPSDYRVNAGELSIMRYEWPRTGETLSHFVVGHSPGGIDYDPMFPDSPVVKNGKLVSYRIFRKAV
jgi:hypothetical protein